MIAYYLVTMVHVIVCVILILVVLLQSGKGADLAGAFGGGATQTAFGSRGPASFLSKLTTGAAVIFMLTSISLSLIGERREVKSIMETGAQSSAPAPKSPTKQPAVQVPTPEQIKQIQQEVEAKQKQAVGAGAARPAAGKTAPQETKAPPAPKP